MSKRSTQKPRQGNRPRQGPSRVAKTQLVQRMKRDTQDVLAGNLLSMLRKQGYEELPLDEIQDRMSKVRDELATFLLSRRG